MSILCAFKTLFKSEEELIRMFKHSSKESAEVNSSDQLKALEAEICKLNRQRKQLLAKTESCKPKLNGNSGSNVYELFK